MERALPLARGPTEGGADVSGRAQSGKKSPDVVTL